jgi:hypothetical protein
MKPPHVSEEEEEPPGVSEEEEESPGVEEEERCGGPPTSPLICSMKPPPAREGGGAVSLEREANLP